MPRRSVIGHEPGDPGATVTVAGANTWMPALPMRNVCSPVIEGWPRIFVTSSLRTTELRCSLWRSQRIPSATVNTGLGSLSLKYSPIRNVVACQLVRCRARRWTKPCSYISLVLAGVVSDWALRNDRLERIEREPKRLQGFTGEVAGLVEHELVLATEWECGLDASMGSARRGGG